MEKDSTEKAGGGCATLVIGIAIFGFLIYKEHYFLAFISLPVVYAASKFLEKIGL